MTPSPSLTISSIASHSSIQQASNSSQQSPSFDIAFILWIATIILSLLPFIFLLLKKCGFKRKTSIKKYFLYGGLYDSSFTLTVSTLLSAVIKNGNLFNNSKESESLIIEFVALTFGLIFSVYLMTMAKEEHNRSGNLHLIIQIVMQSLLFLGIITLSYFVLDFTKGNL